MYRILVACVLTLSLCACRSKKTKEEWLAADRLLLQQQTGSAKVLFYKFFKIGIRAAADTGSAAYRVYRSQLAPAYPWRLRDSLEPQPAAHASIAEYISLYRKYRVLRPLVERTDEDGLPLFFDSLDRTRAATVPRPVRLAQEHALLSLFVYKTPEFGVPVALYESNLADPDRLDSREWAGHMRLYRGFLLQQSELYYLSEETLRANLEQLEKDGAAAVRGLGDFFAAYNVPEARTLAGYRALHHILLAMNHRRMKHDEARTELAADLKAFEREAAEAGLPPELSTRMRRYTEDPAAAERAALHYLAARYSGLVAARLRNTSVATALERTYAPIAGALEASAAYLSKEGLQKGAAAVKEKGGRLWERAKKAVE